MINETAYNILIKGIKRTNLKVIDNDNDLYVYPISESVISSTAEYFGLHPDEELVYMRDTGSWCVNDQGTAITDWGITFVPDNDEPNNIIQIEWCKIHHVEYRNKQLLFFNSDNRNDFSPIDIYMFLKDTDDDVCRINGEILANIFSEAAQNCADPSDEADQHIQELVNQDKYQEAIPYIRQCIKNFPEYISWYNERLAMCCFFNKDYYGAIKAANAGLDAENCTNRAALLLWRYSSNEKLENWEEARKDALFVAMNGNNEQNEEGMSQQDYAKNDFFSDNDEFCKHFLELPYQRRKTLMVVDSYTNLDVDSIQVLGTGSTDMLSFPMGHPVANQLYVGHPLIPNKYIPFENYQLELVEDKVREFCQLAQSLGATEISIDCLNSSSTNQKISGNTNTAGRVDSWSFDANGSYNNEYSRHLIDEISRSISLHQQFEPHQKPFVPQNLVWYQGEPSWQRLVNQRLNGGLSAHEERIETKKSQVLDGRELSNIKGEVESLLADLDIKLNKTEEQNFNQQENAVLSIKVKFAPISQINSNSINNECNKSNSYTSNEKEYLEEVKECLSDGAIGPRERRLLEKIREKLGISEDRAKQLESSLSTLTKDEKEYLTEFKECAINGKVSDKERRLLEKMRTMLGISESRAKELEKM